MSAVNLKIKDEEGTVKKVAHDVEEMSLTQFSESIKLIHEIMDTVKQDQNLVGLIDQFLAESEDLTDEQLIQSVVGAFETLAVKLPDKAVQLLSVLSDIELSTLKAQKLTEVLDIFDAVIEENDIEKLIKRAKKSFATAKVKAAFLGKFGKKNKEQESA